MRQPYDTLTSGKPPQAKGSRVVRVCGVLFLIMTVKALPSCQSSDVEDRRGAEYIGMAYPDYDLEASPPVESNGADITAGLLLPSDREVSIVRMPDIQARRILGIPSGLVHCGTREIEGPVVCVIRAVTPWKLSMPTGGPPGHDVKVLLEVKSWAGKGEEQMLRQESVSVDWPAVKAFLPVAKDKYDIEALWKGIPGVELYACLTCRQIDVDIVKVIREGHKMGKLLASIRGLSEFDYAVIGLGARRQ